MERKTHKRRKEARGPALARPIYATRTEEWQRHGRLVSQSPITTASCRPRRLIELVAPKRPPRILGRTENASYGRRILVLAILALGLVAGIVGALVSWQRPSVMPAAAPAVQPVSTPTPAVQAVSMPTPETAQPAPGWHSDGIRQSWRHWSTGAARSACEVAGAGGSAQLLLLYGVALKLRQKRKWHILADA
jgi:hypothetical protein